MSRRRSWLIALGLVATLGMAGCSSDDAAPASSTSSVSATTTSTSTTTPTTSAAVTTTSEVPVPPPAPPASDPLTGGAPSGNVVVAAKIDNTFPGDQWGVGSADVVVVEMVEGNLSRLVAIFHNAFPGEVGPIRSVRTTDADLLLAYGTPALMFSGGAGGPMDNFASSGLVNASPDVIGSAYWRSSAAAAPYNLHVNSEQVAATVSGISPPNNPGFTFGNDDPRLGGARDVGSISAAFANPLAFEYAGDNAYHYVRRGAQQSDGANGAPFEIQNVLVQHTMAEPDGTVDSAGTPSYKSFTTGGGSFTLYRDGKAIDGTWSRPDTASPTSYVDASGAPVLFRTGKTWIVLAPSQIPTSEG